MTTLKADNRSWDYIEIHIHVLVFIFLIPVTLYSAQGFI